MKIGITGQAGFIGSHLYNLIGTKENISSIHFADQYFDNQQELQNFVKKCDVIVHLAAMNRHENPQVIYDTNVALVQKLINAMEAEQVSPHIIFSSSTQEENDNLYGASKRHGRELFQNWAKNNNAKFTGCIIPNVFGPFGKPNYNSVVATFCHRMNQNQTPEILVDGTVKLIYVGDLCQEFINIATTGESCQVRTIPYNAELKVSQILEKLQAYKSEYLEQGMIPHLPTKFDIQLFNTFCCYIDHKNHFPVSLTKNSDNRGTFVEIAKLNQIGGQVSFSTTVPNITRGNHYHTRKIERFAVIKGKARIDLRKIDSDEILSFILDGENPSYVDMPIWYTHNITNIGTEELYTMFWINEFYNPNDPDTFFEEV